MAASGRGVKGTGDRQGGEGQGGWRREASPSSMFWERGRSVPLPGVGPDGPGCAGPPRGFPPRGETELRRDLS